MHLIRRIIAANQRKADRQILRALRSGTHHAPFALELERRLLGQ
jgi:hypothetical protein